MVTGALTLRASVAPSKGKWRGTASRSRVVTAFPQHCAWKFDYNTALLRQPDLIPLIHCFLVGMPQVKLLKAPAQLCTYSAQLTT
jgi:hypothetical protein